MTPDAVIRRSIATLLVANRGEIACRIIRTARRMGLRTIAVHSDVDRDALHVRMADEAYGIGPAPAAESYLRADRIIEAARRAGADAIHPGYGFLSENPDFAEAVAAAGLLFVGPSPQAIRAMGLKDAAKRRMEAAGVPVVPGFHEEGAAPDRLAEAARAIGFPVLVKARAGGGGKGMRRVDRAEDFADALASAMREAEAAFGDPACLVETYVTAPRHIEMQVFGDTHGNVVHLFERDCSLQRRHQKVVEEAPAPGMTPEMRTAMGEAAVRAAKAIGYAGAGTVEFIADASQGVRPDRFFFMEMNTRLQVEHPVTEAITGLDLVELQLRIAAGQPLPFSQGDLAIRGHAVEARLYAEDPATGFLPQTGTLRRLRFPTDGVRVDTGVTEGDAVTPFYDPMIAKLIVHAETREAALDGMARALAATEVAGVVTNLGFLGRLFTHESVRRGDLDTGLIARDVDAFTAPRPAPAEALAAAAILRSGLAGASSSPDPWTALVGWRGWERPSALVALFDGAKERSLRVTRGSSDEFRLDGDDAPSGPVRLVRDGDAIRVTIDGRTLAGRAEARDATIRVDLGGQSHRFDIPDSFAATSEGASGDGDTIRSPMPGLVKLVAVAAGDTVAKGRPLVTVEAMKMEHTLLSPRDGVVAEVTVAPGAQVTLGAPLVRLEPPA